MNDTPAPIHTAGRLGMDRGGLSIGLFQRIVAGLSIVAWLSVGAQIRLLAGSRGLRPWTDSPIAGRLPALFRDDTFLVVIPLVGASLCLGALLLRPARALLLVSTILYAALSLPLQDFWEPPDNLLLECGLVASLLPSDRSLEATQFLGRFVLFKILFETGMSKLLSPTHGWVDGTAMRSYFEVTILPTPIARSFHDLPVGVHRILSWATLGVEFVGSFLIFGGRPARLLLFPVVIVFQLMIILTANFGILNYLTLSLSVFLLDEDDLETAKRWFVALASRRPRRLTDESAAAAGRGGTKTGWGGWPSSLAVASYVLVSVPGLMQWSPWFKWCPNRGLSASYAMFDAVWETRVETEFEVDNGAGWTPRHLRYKPGDPARSSTFVAPYLPRVDIQLAYHGRAAFRGGTSPLISRLLEQLCADPEAVAGLFADALPDHPRRTRVSFWAYRYAGEAEARDGTVWVRAPLGPDVTRMCPVNGTTESSL